MKRNWPGAARILFIKGNPEFYDGAKAENFEIDFLSRKINPYGSKTYQKKQNSNILGVCFLTFFDLAQILGEIQDLKFSRLHWSPL